MKENNQKSAKNHPSVKATIIRELNRRGVLLQFNISNEKKKLGSLT